MLGDAGQIDRFHGGSIYVKIGQAPCNTRQIETAENIGIKFECVFHRIFIDCNQRCHIKSRLFITEFLPGKDIDLRIIKLLIDNITAGRFDHDGLFQ